MSSLNSCSFIGRVGKDVESKSLDSGKFVCNFTLAVSETYKDKSGEKKEDTQWINCVVFGKLAEIVDKYVKKGDLLYLNGRLVNRSYEKDGVKKYFTEVIINDMKMLGGKKSGSTAPEATIVDVVEGSDKQQGKDSDLPF